MYFLLTNCKYPLIVSGDINSDFLGPRHFLSLDVLFDKVGFDVYCVAASKNLLGKIVNL